MVDLKELDGSKSVKDNIYVLQDNVKAVEDNLKDKVDAESVEEIKKNYVAKDKLKDISIPLTDQPSINNLESGDKISILFSKIKKWFTGLKDGSFIVKKARVLNISDNNVINLCDNYNSKSGEMIINYESGAEPITTYKFKNGKHYDLFKISKNHFHGSSENVVTNLGTNCRYTANPKGGFYSSASASVTGAIKITLPCTWSDTMLNFKVVILNHSTQVNKLLNIDIAGLNEASGFNRWVGLKANIITGYKDYKVRFGHDGERCCVYIGEVDSVWSYAMVHITNVEEHYYLLTGDEWNISIVDEFQNVTDTLEDNLVVASDSQKLGGLTRDNFMQRVDLTGQGQKTSYRKTVIGLFEVTNTTSSMSTGFVNGSIIFRRRNGFTSTVKIDIVAQQYYATGKIKGMITQSNASLLVARLCTFIYNQKKYCGIQYFYDNAESDNIDFYGASSHDVFAVDYYDTHEHVAINEEINNSISFDSIDLNNEKYFNNNVMLHSGNLNEFIKGGTTEPTSYVGDNCLYCVYE